MPYYDIFDDSAEYQKGFIIQANNEAEAIGKARERWNLPDSRPLYATLQIESEATSEALDLAGLLHKTGMSVYIACRANSDSRLQEAFTLINRAYVLLATFADKLDNDARTKQKIMLDARTTRPTRKGNIS